MREGTHDECGVLLLVGLREEDHGVHDLYAGVCVDIDAVWLVVGGRLCECGVYGGASDFDSDEGVQGGDGCLERLEGGEFVWEYAK